jgi:hypothetical protein
VRYALPDRLAGPKVRQEMKTVLAKNSPPTIRHFELGTFLLWCMWGGVFCLIAWWTRQSDGPIPMLIAVAAVATAMVAGTRRLYGVCCPMCRRKMRFVRQIWVVEQERQLGCGWCRYVWNVMRCDPCDAVWRVQAGGSGEDEQILAEDAYAEVQAQNLRVTKTGSIEPGDAADSR